MQQYQVNDSNSQSRLVSAVPRCHEQKEKEKLRPSNQFQHKGE